MLEKLWRGCIYFYHKYFERKSDNFFTYFFRPKYAENVKLIPASIGDTSDVAIVIQGNIPDVTFLEESIRIYQKLFPSAIIILSTWNDEIEKISQLDMPGVHVITSEPPINEGHGHINHQLVNTRAGLLKAQELGAKYVLKIRTDWRIYSPYALLSLVQILKQYPIQITNGARGRIISTNVGTMSGLAYNISDLLLFGYTEDLLQYFPAELDPRDLKACEINHVDFNSPIEYSRQRPGEIYFATKYIERLGFELKWTIEDSAYYRNTLFIIIDAEMLDAFWDKYTRVEYRWKRYELDEVLGLNQVTYAEWLAGQMEESNA